MYSLGIDIGYSSIKLSVVDKDNRIISNAYILHKGMIKNVLIKSLKELAEKYKTTEIIFGAVTGSGSKLLSGTIIKHVNEAAAVIAKKEKTKLNIKALLEYMKSTADIQVEDKSILPV
jgi:activator of 2-hydroxyglutaryl-CoA dehydratase